MFYTKLKGLCETRGTNPTRVCAELGIAKTTLSYWKNTKGFIPKADQLKKIADYFNVPIDYFVGDSTERDIDRDLKVALFNGSEDVTDEMWEEVKSFARFVEEREANKRRKE